jgi:hypothetical protein
VHNFGPSEPPVKGLVQGAYSHAWVDMNLARQVGLTSSLNFCAACKQAAVSCLVLHCYALIILTQL